MKNETKTIRIWDKVIGRRNNMLEIGTRTKYGEVADITNKGEDLYYVIVNDKLEVSLVPVKEVEDSLADKA